MFHFQNIASKIGAKMSNCIKNNFPIKLQTGLVANDKSRQAGIDLLHYISVLYEYLHEPGDPDNLGFQYKQSSWFSFIWAPGVFRVSEPGGATIPG